MMLHLVFLISVLSQAFALQYFLEEMCYPLVGMYGYPLNLCTTDYGAYDPQGSPVIYQAAQFGDEINLYKTAFAYANCTIPVLSISTVYTYNATCPSSKGNIDYFGAIVDSLPPLIKGLRNVS